MKGALQNHETDPDWRDAERRALADIHLAGHRWVGLAASALIRCISEPVEEGWMFSWTQAHWARHGEVLRVLAKGAHAQTNNLTEDFPLLVTLAKYWEHSNPPPIATLLLRVVLEYHLRSQHLAAIRELMEFVRGLLKVSGRHALERALGAAVSINKLLSRMAELEVSAGKSGQLTGHTGFDRLWRRELRAICEQLTVLPRISAEDEDADGAPYVSLSDSLSFWITDSDSDEGAGLETLEVTSREPGQRLISTRASLAQAIAWGLQRRTSADLCRDPENILPLPVLSQCWSRALAVASTAEEDGLADQLVHLLAIESGLSEREAVALILADSTSHGGPALDLESSVLRRPEVRPDSAYKPKPDADRWQPTGGDIIVPISEAVVDLARRLQVMRDRQGATNRHLSHVVSNRSDQRPILRAIRVACPELGVTPSMYLRRLAAGVAATHGYGAAQLVFGQTFGLSPAPAYYIRFRAAELAACIWRLGPVAASQGPGFPTGCKLPEHWIGSRVAAQGKPVFELFAALQREFSARSAPGRPSPERTLAEWALRRDRIALHLFLAVAHRPGLSLASIRIGDFVEGKPLVILGDKRSDPAHLVRVASTGLIFVSELESYKAFLAKASRVLSPSGEGRVARNVLAGVLPLFTSPNDGGEAKSFDFRSLAARFPEPWHQKQNLHRHLLCQELINQGLDPELIYFQMGWIGGHVHATSDMAPQSPLQIAELVAPAIDRALVQIGWKTEHAAKRESHRGVVGSLVDWAPALEAGDEESRGARIRLRQALMENRREIDPQVATGMMHAVTSVLHEFELVANKGRQEIRPRLKPAAGCKLVIDSVMVGSVLDHFRASRYSAAHRATARRQLADMLRVGVRKGWYDAYIPAVTILSASQDVSPFLRGSGVAVRHADHVRHKLADLCAAAGEQEDATCIAMIAVMSCTRHRRFEEASAIAAGAHLSTHAIGQPDLLRIPVGSGHASITGVPALILRRLAGESQLAVVDKSALGRFIGTKFPELSSGIQGTAEIARRFEQTMLVAGRLELSGIARPLSLGHVTPALVTAERAASVVDGLTVPSDDVPGAVDDELEELGPRHARAAKPPLSGRPISRDVVGELLKFFNPDFDGRIDGASAKPERSRNVQVAKAIEVRVASMSSVITSKMALLEYMLDLARNGGPRSAGGLKANSIYTMVGRFARHFDELSDGCDLERLDAEDLEQLMAATIRCSPNSSRPRVLFELRAFHKFCVSRYDIASPNWSCLQIVAGQSSEGSDPAVVSDHEASLVIDQLQKEVVATAKFAPRQKTLCELRQMAALLAEGSGVRPRSIHGLTLADVHISSSGDYVHLRARGRYSSVKTRTSVGFVRLEGELWERSRSWAQGWIEARRSGHDRELWHEIPLFQVPQEDLGQRYRIREVFDRVGRLVRWATGQQNGRVYWFRKRRVLARYKAVHESSLPSSRDIGRVMGESGHAGIATPLARYLGDLSMLRSEDPLPQERAEVAGLSGISPAALDRREARRKASCLPPARPRIAAALSLENPEWLSRARIEIGPPPHFHQGKEDPSAQVIAEAMELILRGVRQTSVADRIGMDAATVGEVVQQMQVFTSRTGVRFAIERGALNGPRRVQAAAGIWHFLQSMDHRMLETANEWASLVGRCGISDGCPIVSADILIGFRAALEEQGILLVERHDGGVSYCTPLMKSGASFGVWPAMCWVLAALHITSQVLKRRPA